MIKSIILIIVLYSIILIMICYKISMAEEGKLEEVEKKAVRALKLYKNIERTANFDRSVVDKLFEEHQSAIMKLQQHGGLTLEQLSLLEERIKTLEEKFNNNEVVNNENIKRKRK